MVEQETHQAHTFKAAAAALLKLDTAALGMMAMAAMVYQAR
jgi:hypothetical protein